MQLSNAKTTLKENKLKFLKSISYALLFFIACCLLFSFVFSIIFYNFENSTKMIRIASLSSLFLSGLVACFIVAKITGENYFLIPLIISIFAIILFFVSCIFSNTKIFSSDFLIKLMFPVFCFSGSLLGKKRVKFTRKKHYKRK